MLVRQNVGARSVNHRSQLFVDTCLLLQQPDKRLHTSLTVQQLLVLLGQLLKQSFIGAPDAAALLVYDHSFVFRNWPLFARLLHQSVVFVFPIFWIRILLIYYCFRLNHLCSLRKHQRASALLVSIC